MKQFSELFETEWRCVERVVHSLQLNNFMRVLNVHAVDPELTKQIFRQVRVTVL